MNNMFSCHLLLCHIGLCRISRNKTMSSIMSITECPPGDAHFLPSLSFAVHGPKQIHTAMYLYYGVHVHVFFGKDYTQHQITAIMQKSMNSI